MNCNSNVGKLGAYLASFMDQKEARERKVSSLTAFSSVRLTLLRRG